MSSLAGIIDNLILTFGFTLLIGWALFPPIFRNTIALLVNWLIFPLASHVPFYITVLVMATIVSTASTLVQKYKTDGELVRRFGEKNKAFQKAFSEARISGDKKTLKKLEEERISLLEDQSKISIQQLKSTGYTAIVSLPLLMWGYWYLGTLASPPMINLPFIGAHAMTELFFIIPYWILWLGICSLAIGYIIRKVLSNQTAVQTHSP